MSADLKCVVSNAAPVISISSAKRIAKAMAETQAEAPQIEELAHTVANVVVDIMSDIFGGGRVMSKPPKPVAPPAPEPLNPNAIRCLTLADLGISPQWLHDMADAGVAVRLPSDVPGLPKRLQGAAVKAERLVDFAERVARFENQHVRLMRDEVRALNALETCTWNDPQRAYHRQRVQALGAEIAHTLREREAYRTAILQATLLDT